jgi:hypothetical protein
MVSQLYFGLPSQQQPPASKNNGLSSQAKKQ